MKPYKKLECQNTVVIANGIYKFINDNTDLLVKKAIGWQFIDHKQLLISVPELAQFLQQHKLIPNSAAVVILEEDGQLPLHIDELPVIAKMNFPVINTEGWSIQWFSVSEQDLTNCPKTTNQFGKEVEMLESLPESAFTLLEEILDFDSPIIFNSRIPHTVRKQVGKSPRIIASFTFAKEPSELLK